MYSQNRRIPSMHQLIKMFQIDLFHKVCLHKSIFSPFTPFKTNMNKVYQQQRLIRQYKFQKTQATVDQLGNYEYIYGHNSQFLDVISCVKNCKYRFILPHQRQGQGREQKIRNKQNPQQTKQTDTLIRIIDQILVMVFHNHVYIHDLIRHNNRLIIQAFDEKQPQCGSIVGVCKFKLNEYYIYRVSEVQAIRALISVQIFSIDMSDNFNLVKCMHKLIRVDQQQGSCQRLCVSESNYKLSIGVLIKIFQTNSFSLKIFGISCKEAELSDLKQQFKVSNIANSAKCFNISAYEVDPIILNICGIFQNYAQRVSSIRDSWVIRTQPHQQSQLNGDDAHFRNLHMAEGYKFMIVYQRGSTSFFMIPTDRNGNKDDCNPTTILSHHAKIHQVVRCGMNTLLVDQNYQIWCYDFSQEQEIYLPHPILLLSLKDKLNPYNSNVISQVHVYESQADHKFTVCVNDLTFYVVYPSLIYAGLQSNSKQQNTHHRLFLKSKARDETPSFLSIQSQNFIGLDHNNQELGVMKLLQLYFKFSTGQQNLNVRDYILQQVLPQLDKYLSHSNCQIIRKQQLWSTFVQVQARLMVVMRHVLQTTYDCEANQFYWQLAYLMNEQQLKKDIKFVADMLIKEQLQRKQSQLFLGVILNQLKLKDYLAAKCTNTNYAMTCTTPFMKCLLLSGCSCVYKRVLRYFIKCGTSTSSLESNTDAFYQPFMTYQHIIHVLWGSNWRHELNLLLNKKQRQMKDRIQKEREKRMKRIDEEWQSEFGTQQKFYPITDSQFYHRSTHKKQRKSYQIAYKRQQQQQNELYTNLPAGFAQRMIELERSCEGVGKINDSYQQQQAMGAYLQQIGRICNKYNLILNKDHEVIAQPDGQCKIAMCILVASRLYRKYGKPKQWNQQSWQEMSRQSQFSCGSLSSANLSRGSYGLGKQIRNCTSLYRRVWLFMVSLLNLAIKLKYIIGPARSQQNKKHLESMIDLTIQSIANPKYFPALASSFTTQSDSKVLTSNQLACLIQSILKVQTYRFQSSPPTKQLRHYKYRYPPQIWDNGILSIIQISQNLKKQAQILP